MGQIYKKGKNKSEKVEIQWVKYIKRAKIKVKYIKSKIWRTLEGDIMLRREGTLFFGKLKNCKNQK